MKGYVVFILLIGLTICLQQSQVRSIGCDQFNYAYTDSIDLSLVLKEEVVPVDKNDPSAGSRVVNKYKQKWKGVDVWGYGATYDAMTGELVFSKFAECIHADLDDAEPLIKEEDALDVAYSSLREKKKQEEFFPETDMKNKQLLIFVGGDDIARLVYRFNIQYEVTENGDSTGVNAMVMVNAKDGKFISAEKYVVAYAMTGQGGNQKFGFYRYGEGDWKDRLLDVTKERKSCVLAKNNIEVISAQQIRLSRKIMCFAEFLSSYSEECDPPSPNTEEQRQAHDAYYFATAFQDLLKNTYNFDLLERCHAIQLCVHYAYNEATNVAEFHYRDFSQFGKYDEKTCHVIFSLGSTFAHSMVAPSTVAHELGHGIMDVNNLFDIARQPYAVFEAFADLCGALFKAYITGQDEPDWHVGSEIFIDSGNMTALRYMDNPPRDGLSIQCTKDYAKFVDAMPSDNQHFLNGIYNKAFYHLVVTEGLETEYVFNVILRAVTYYWTAILNFDERLCAIMEAALDPFNSLKTPESLSILKKISRAFSRVGVYCSIERKNTTSGVEKLKASIGCPTGWKTFREKFSQGNEIISHCFKFSKRTTNWEKASNFCKRRGGRLAVIDTGKKVQFIKRNIAPGYEYFIGAAYDEDHNTWKWTTGEKVAKRNIERESNKFNCLSLSSTSTEENKSVINWFAKKCGSRNRHICELTCS